MRQRKRAEREPSETLRKELSGEIGDGDDGERKGFYACYLLISLSPRHKGHTYIGFTVKPRHRIRQHNGGIGSGAWRTKRRRPWEMVFRIYGFPSNVSALQHLNESLAARKAATSFKSLSGVANKIKVAYTMLNLPSWQTLSITVNYFSTKCTKRSAVCPSLPQHMKVKICYMDELPYYVKGDESFLENEEWDGEKRDEGSSGSKIVEETSSDSMFGNAEHDKNVLGDEMAERLYGWVSEEDCRQQSTLIELLTRPYSNVTSSNSSFVGKLGNNSSISELIKDSSLESKPPAEELSKRIVTIDDDQPPSSHIVPCEVELIDVSTPSPLCRGSLWGNKSCKRGRDKGRHIVPGEAEVIDLTTPSPICRSSLWRNLIDYT